MSQPPNFTWSGDERLDSCNGFCSENENHLGTDFLGQEENRRTIKVRLYERSKKISSPCDNTSYRKLPPICLTNVWKVVRANRSPPAGKKRYYEIEGSVVPNSSICSILCRSIACRWFFARNNRFEMKRTETPALTPTEIDSRNTNTSSTISPPIHRVYAQLYSVVNVGVSYN